MSGNQGRANYQQQPNIQQQQRFTNSPFNPDGYPQPHQNQAIYQTQGGPPGVQNQQQSQSNPAQSMSNAVQQNQQARLTPMSQPTAPSTPPTQQQQQPQQQGAPQYAVQLSQQGIPPTAGGVGNPRSTQYRPQTTQQRRPQQPMNQQYQIYQPQIPGMPYGFVLPHGAHVRAPATFGYMPFPQVYNNQYVAAAQNYQQIQAPPNGQQRPSAQPQASAPAMAQPQTSEYAYQSMYTVEQPVMQAPPVPTQQQAPPPQAQPPKPAVKKIGSKAIKIINPITGKNIFDENDSGEGGTTSGSVDKAITASINELNKDEAVDKEQQEKEKEPSTPVVSAISDGPSVDITPKHQVNKGKKKPPEVIAPPPAPVVVLAPPPEAPKPVEVEVEVVEPEVVPKDDENNDVEVEIPAAPEPVIEEEVVEVPAPQPVLDVNDTNNNNNYEEEEEKPEVEETMPQDSNNNSTDDKSIMTSPSIRAAPVEAASRKTSTVDGPIDYDDGQWSPANLAGKKYYTRDQLLKLKDLPIAAAPPAMTKLPENVANVLMKNNKETLTNTLTQTMPPPGMAGLARGSVPFNDPINSLIAPKFMTNQMNNRNPYQKRPSQQGNKNQQGPGNRNSSQSGIIKMSLSLHDDVKLNEADNAWKPSHLVKKPELTEEERVTYDLLNRFRSMLNKLTAENFDVLVKEVKNYKIDTSERLDGVISLVFEKAISEPKFAPTYAILCREVSYINTAPSGEGQKKNTLKVKLITQCQREFERHKEESKVFNEIEEKLREIENAEVVKTRDDEKTRLEEEHYRVRQRANGTVKFIGELFKIDMLTSKIMRSCVDLLLQEITEEKIERVCKLLTTIGGKLEIAEGRQTLNKYFEQLSDMLRPTHQIIKSSRIKFEIQNLQDLRHNNWKSRRVEATPKTLDQIQTDMEQEQQMINYQTRQNSKDDRNRGGNYGGNNRNRQQQQDSDGWSVQQNKNSRSQPIQFKNIPLPTISGEAKIGGPANFQNFMVQNTNKFSGLPVDTDTDGPQRFGGGGGGGSKNSSMERNRDSRNYNYNNGDRGNAPYSGRSSGSGQGSRNSSRARDDSDGRGGPSRSLQAPPRHQQVPMAPASSLSFSGAVKKEGVVAAPAKPMTREEVALNYEAMLAIVNDFRDDKFNVEDAMTKLKPLAINKDVLVEIYNKFLDRKDIDRENLMLVVCELMKTKKVSLDENRAALIDIMVFAPEMMCDVPRVYEYIGQFLAELIIASVLTFQEVLVICGEDIKTHGENMLGYIFTATDKRHGAQRLQTIVAGKNCDLEMFIKDGNFDRWSEANNFAEKLKRGPPKVVPDVMATVKLMLNEKKTLDAIMIYINSTDCSSDPNFIRNLTNVVIEVCCDEYSGSGQPSYKLQGARLNDLSQLLQRYIDNVLTRELQCVNALVGFAFTRDFPPGLLNSTFETLYDNDVLSSEAYEAWEKDNDNQQGKGVAICSTRQFFTKLEEDKDDDDGEFYTEEGETL